MLDVGSSSGALARHVSRDNYVGFEIDLASKEQARRDFPGHIFLDELPSELFDTVVALAVVEHLSKPAVTVGEWTACTRPGGRLVLTTPHRAFRWAHEAGAKMGLSSQVAADDHETLFTKSTLVAELRKLPLTLEHYRRFLFGMNQLFVFRRAMA